MKLVAESLSGNLDTLASYEPFNEGDTGELRVYLEKTLSQEEIVKLETKICNQGAILTEPLVQDARILVIKFKKAIAPLPIIAGVLAGIAVLGWQLFSETTPIPLWAWVLGGFVIGYTVLRRKKWLGKR